MNRPQIIPSGVCGQFVNCPYSVILRRADTRRRIRFPLPVVVLWEILWYNVETYTKEVLLWNFM